MEFDAQYIHRISALNSVQMRLGTGFYTHSGKGRYSDYSNFREKQLIRTDGTDNWSGFVRAAATPTGTQRLAILRARQRDDETPQLALYWMPLIGPTAGEASACT